MKNSFVAVSLCVVSACTMSNPQTAGELRQMAGSSAFISSKSVSVSQSPAAAARILRAMSRNCFNRVVTTRSVYRVGPTGPQSLTSTIRYTSSVTAKAGQTTLSVRNKDIGKNVVHVFGTEDGLISLVVDAKPASGGVNLTVTSLAPALRGNLKAVEKSMATGNAVCPNN